MISAIIDRINQHSAAWDESFRIALARREFAKLASDHPELATDKTAKQIVKGCKLPDDVISVAWHEELQDRHVAECRERSGKAAHEIERLTLQVQSVGDHLKSLKSSLVERTASLCELATIISQPLIPELPPLPNRQRELLTVDGEEWRLVPMADVLQDYPKSKAVVANKLGAITLGGWADRCAKWSQHGGHEVTLRQFAAIDEVVAAWHAENMEAEVEQGAEAVEA